MNRELFTLYKGKGTVSSLLRERRHHETLIFVVFFITLLGLTPLLILQGTKTGFGLILGSIGIVILAVAIIRWPIVGLYTLAASALLIEEAPLSTPIGTDHLYVFYWPTQLAGFFERPIGLLILFTFFIFLLRRLMERERLLQGGALLIPFALYMLCVFGAAAYGLITGGDLKIIVVELRPFWYTFTSYILAYNFVRRKSHIRAFFWLVILSAGIKALQGLYVYLIAYHGNLATHDTIMSHEESFFFAALLLLVIISSLHYRYRPQFIAAL